MLTPDKITEIFCIADDFCKEFTQEVKKTTNFVPMMAAGTGIVPVR